LALEEHEHDKLVFESQQAQPQGLGIYRECGTDRSPVCRHALGFVKPISGALWKSIGWLKDKKSSEP